MYNYGRPLASMQSYCQPELLGLCDRMITISRSYVFESGDGGESDRNTFRTV
jgi:hypothetical protein